MECEVLIRLVLVDPPQGIDFGMQSGSGANYTTLFVQQGTGGDLTFDFSVKAAESDKDGSPNFKGPIVQGPRGGRFVYIDVGTYAGQKFTHWSRRMKVPLQAITWDLINKAVSKPGHRLLGKIAGRGEDGGPNCATVRLLEEWKVIAASAV